MNKKYITISLLIIVVLVCLFLGRSLFYQDKIKSIFNDSITEKTYVDSNLKEYITEKYWNRIKNETVSNAGKEYIDYSINTSILNSFVNKGTAKVNVYCKIYKDLEHKKSDEESSIDFLVKYEIKNRYVYIKEIYFQDGDEA